MRVMSADLFFLSSVLPGFRGKGTTMKVLSSIFRMIPGVGNRPQNLTTVALLFNPTVASKKSIYGVDHSPTVTRVDSRNSTATSSKCSYSFSSLNQ